MGFFDKLFGGKAAPAGGLTVLAPVEGAVVPLEQIPDPVFGQGILGPGCGIEPAGETVTAPFDGTVTQTTETRHAVGVTSADGVELLIHVGLDTVAMGGKGFECLVEEGQSIQAGQALMKFSKAEIAAAGHPTVTAVVVTNADDFSGVEVVAQGTVPSGAPLMKLTK